MNRAIPLGPLPSVITRKMRRQETIHQVADLMVKDRDTITCVFSRGSICNLRKHTRNK